jgi:pimeloyl-ACP methyl ester carboxylesterase
MWITLAIAVVAAVVLLAVAALILRAVIQARRAAKLAIRTQNGVNENSFLRIGGIEQWVSIRGEDRANPLLIVAHGGPGSCMTPFIDDSTQAWEKHFTVVHWDQRGAGLTYSRSPKAQGELSLARIADDGIEVTRHALQRTGQAKALLLGISWGSVVIMAMARRQPELFHAVVGAGQVVDMQRNEAVGYESLLARVRAAGDQRAEATLLKLGAPPYASLKQLMAERRVLNAHPPASERGVQGRIIRLLLTAPGFSLKQILDWFQGASFSGVALMDTLMTYSDDPPAPLGVPSVLIQGADDIQTPTSLAGAYFEAMQAPAKRYVSIPGGGHYAVVSMADAFLSALLAEVRPFAANA